MQNNTTTTDSNALLADLLAESRALCKRRGWVWHKGYTANGFLVWPTGTIPDHPAPVFVRPVPTPGTDTGVTYVTCCHHGQGKHHLAMIDTAQLIDFYL